MTAFLPADLPEPDLSVGLQADIDPDRELLCLLPREVADELGGMGNPLGLGPAVRVVVEERGGDRRRELDRRAMRAPARSEAERRAILHTPGRRVAERRAVLVDRTDLAFVVPGPNPHRAAGVRLVERWEPTAVERARAHSARLVIAAQAGDGTAFSQLYQQHAQGIESYLRLLLTDVHEAEDATQEVFIRVLQALPRYRLGAAPFETWLVRVARNYALDRLPQVRRIRPEDPAALLRLSDANGGDSHARDPRAEGLLRHIGHLPSTQSQVLFLRYAMDMSFGEIAVVLQRSPGAVRMLHQRGMAMLRTRAERVTIGSGRRTAFEMHRLRGDDRVLRSRRRTSLAWLIPSPAGVRRYNAVRRETAARPPA